MEDEILLTGQSKPQNTITEFNLNQQKRQFTNSEPSDTSSTSSEIRQRNKNPMTIIILCMAAMIVILSLPNFYQSWLSKIIVGLNLGQIQKHNNTTSVQGFPDPIKILALENEVGNKNDPLYNLCPVPMGAFHIYLNKTDPEMEHINEEYEKRATHCNVTIVGVKDLKNLKKKWNTKFPQKTINLSLINETKTKQILLILLRLYFKAGTYSNIQIPYSRIDDRCWKYALTGYTALYGDFIEEKDGIYVPDIWKFIKVRFPYSMEIKSMIERLIDGGDVLEDCKKEQCLIIKCYDN